MEAVPQRQGEPVDQWRVAAPCLISTHKERHERGRMREVTHNDRRGRIIWQFPMQILLGKGVHRTRAHHPWPRPPVQVDVQVQATPGWTAGRSGPGGNPTHAPQKMDSWGAQLVPYKRDRSQPSRACKNLNWLAHVSQVADRLRSPRVSLCSLLLVCGS